MNIIQLREKALPELIEIAKGLGITKVESLSKEDLVYRILDEQAIAIAQKRAVPTSNNTKDQKPKPQQKREKVSPKPTKKEEAPKRRGRPKKQETIEKEETKAKVEEPKQENAPKKRGRPRKVVTQ